MLSPKRWMQRQFESAMDLNRKNILDAVPRKTDGRLLDLGCDDGAWTMRLAERMGTRDVHGIEIVESRAAQARARGVEVTVANLNEPLPFPSGSFDLVHANQVIEHVSDVDVFTSEIVRVLRPGGAVVISTENGSSWHNVGAAALGWQIFSLTNMSGQAAGIGNPLALHRHAPIELKSWTHKVIFNFRGLREFLELHGLRDVEIRGAGYYPLPAAVGQADPRHAHFLTAVGHKPEDGR